MKDKFTPGPWQPIKMSALPLLWIGEGDGTTIATIALREESNANAQLISLAPEMHSFISAVYAEMGPRTEIGDAAKAILVKVENPSTG